MSKAGAQPSSFDLLGTPFWKFQDPMLVNWPVQRVPGRGRVSGRRGSPWGRGSTWRAGLALGAGFAASLQSWAQAALQEGSPAA